MTTDDLIKAYHEYQKAIARGHEVRFTTAASCGKHILQCGSPEAAAAHLNELAEYEHCDFPYLYRYEANIITAAIAATQE